MSALHTPGPWRVEADGVDEGDKDGFEPFGACGCCGSPWMSADDPEVAKADARLIAAAPELLEALKQCAAVCAGEVISKNGLIVALQSARAALSKAQGQETCE